MTESYLYIFVRTDLSIPHQIVQSNHAALHLALNHQGIQGVPNIVLIGVPNLKSLLKVERKLMEAQIHYFAWHEPDNDMGFTSIATVPLSGHIRSILSNYRLYQMPRGISECPLDSKSRGAGLSPAGAANLSPSAGSSTAEQRLLSSQVEGSIPSRRSISNPS